MHKNFCKICNTTAPMGATADPTIILVHKDDPSKAFTIHFHCIDKQLTNSWQRAKKSQSLKSRTLKEHVLTRCGSNGIQLSNFDFIVLEEAWDQDGNRGVDFKKMFAKIVVRAVVEFKPKGNTEEVSHTMSVPGNGIPVIPLAASA